MSLKKVDHPVEQEAGHAIQIHIEVVDGGGAVLQRHGDLVVGIDGVQIDASNNARCADIATWINPTRRVCTTDR